MQYLAKALIVFAVAISANAMLHDFRIHPDDTRKIIPIGDFGFDENGSLQVDIVRSDSTEVLNFIIYEKKNSFNQETFLLEDACDVKNAGFVNATQSFNVKFATEQGKKYIYDDDKTPFTDDSINYLPPAYYNVYLLRCSEDYQKSSISIHWDAHNVNKDGQADYLSSGMKNVIPVSYAFAFFWITFAVFWIILMLRGRKKVNRVHIFLSVFIVLAAISLFFEGGQYQIMNKSGRKKAMGIFFYFFTISRALSFFLIVVIIGTGLTFIKKHLSRKEMGIIATVIVLQILVNVALVVIGNTPKSSPHRAAWLVVLRLGDLICCCCVVVPVLWSLSDLRARADTQQDEAATAADQKSITKLKLFQRYYLLVVGYVYLRIIVIYMLNLYVKYTDEWTIDLVDEILSLGFYSFICYLFRPEAENPFIEFDDDDAYVAPTLSETHVEDGDIQLDEVDDAEKKTQNSAVLVPDE